MAYTIDDLRRFFPHPNVQAFYQVVRFKESSLDDSAYRMVNGGPPITDFSRHPYEGLKTTEGGHAAGAPQFIPTTWGGLQRKYGFTDFSPPNQDLGYVGCLIERNALGLVMEGRFDEAVLACRKEWSSLPGAAESRASWTMDKARDLYMRAGGSLKDVAGTPYEPVQEPVPVEPERKIMDPLSAIALFGPLIANLIPQVAKLFDKKVETPGKIEAAQKVIETIVTSTGSVNEQQALQKIATDPVMLETAKKAIMTEPTIMGMLEVGGGIKAAREANLAIQNADKPFWYNPAFWMSLVLMPLVYWIVGSVLVGRDDATGMWQIFGTAFNQETRSGTVNLVIGMVLGGIVGIWFGTSYGSMRKTEIAAEATARGEGK